MELRQAKRNTNTVMIITGDLDNWYYMELVRNVIRFLDDSGYISIMAYSDNQLEKEEEYLRLAIEERYAGVVFVNVRGDMNLKEILVEYNYPVVFLNRGIKLAYFNMVCNDNYHGAYQATSYLIDMGHKRIGHLMGSSFSPTAIDRRKGYVEAMEDRGLPVTKNSIYQGNYDWITAIR